MALPVLTLSVGGGTHAGATEPHISATVYIGSHFEVRDHEQPTKYVFNGALRVASVIGSLSAVPRVQRVRLWQGWNLLSPAVSASNLLGQFQSSQAGGVQAVYEWNAATGDYVEVAPGQRVAAATVLWVKVVSNFTASLSGVYTETHQSHCAGRRCVLSWSRLGSLGAGASRECRTVAVRHSMESVADSVLKRFGPPF